MERNEEDRKDFDKILTRLQIDWGYLNELREFKRMEGFTVQINDNLFYGKNVDNVGRMRLGSEAFRGFKEGDSVHISVTGKNVKIARKKENL